MVTWILQQLSNTGTADPRDIENEIGTALRIAVRNGNNSTGNKILDFLHNDQRLYPGEKVMKFVIRVCMVFGNVDLLGRILKYRARHEPECAQMLAENGLPVWKNELDILFRSGSRSGLRVLLRNGSISSNRLGRYLPLDWVFYCSREDLALLLLSNGGNIYARNRDGNTALQSAVRRGDMAGTTFLLNRGANPRDVMDGESACLRACRQAAAEIPARVLRTKLVREAQASLCNCSQPSWIKIPFPTRYGGFWIRGGIPLNTFSGQFLENSDTAHDTWTSHF
ncbi:hypothetical protein CC86DRAFT_405338 [Ophiobolus disseminans]|uniref:Uncharacterized protein n=1 Tax=Ophiobolus disseminans TaxID=1469910 RepID=A0A6A7A266_9PLEO|nr:hypothetical protein CC86DRAFT_405338 [Ophiobolus disseminans]